jgi:hypothetical protein
MRGTSAHRRDRRVVQPDEPATDGAASTHEIEELRTVEREERSVGRGSDRRAPRRAAQETQLAEDVVRAEGPEPPLATVVARLGDLERARLTR